MLQCLGCEWLAEAENIGEQVSLRTSVVNPCVGIRERQN